MNIQTARQVIANQIDDEWEETVICWPNHEFTEPKDEAWLRMNLKFGKNESVTIGSNGQTRQTGIVWLNLFSPRFSGTDTAYERMDIMKSIFNNLSLADGLQFKASNVMDIGVQNDGLWYQNAVWTPFYFFEGV